MTQSRFTTATVGRSCRRWPGTWTCSLPTRRMASGTAATAATITHSSLAKPTTEPQPPDDVMEWVEETYNAYGVHIWIEQWRSGDDVIRAYMERIARTPSGGT